MKKLVTYLGYQEGVGLLVNEVANHSTVAYDENLHCIVPHAGSRSTHVRHSDPESQVKELGKSLNQFDQVKNIIVWQIQIITGNGFCDSDTLLKAAIAYNKAAKKYFGKFADLNPVKL